MNPANPTPISPEVPPPGGHDLTELVIWGAVALMILLAFAIGVYIFRRKMLPGANAWANSTWTLQELAELRDDGSLTDAEYRVLRTQVIESLSNSDR